MKRWIATMLTVGMLCTMTAAAEVESRADLEAMTKEELVDLAAELLGFDAPAKEAPEAELKPAAEPVYEALERGMKGDAVKAMQARLIELGYLTGSADGAFGGGTQASVMAFQRQNGLTANGIADEAMQQLLFSDTCPAAIEYAAFDAETALKAPETVSGTYTTCTGTVLQVSEQENEVALRITLDDGSIVWVCMARTESYTHIMEDVRVTVYGTYGGLYTYTTVSGDIASIPEIDATQIIQE